MATEASAAGGERVPLSLRRPMARWSSAGRSDVRFVRARRAPFRAFLRRRGRGAAEPLET